MEYKYITNFIKKLFNNILIIYVTYYILYYIICYKIFEINLLIINT